LNVEAEPTVNARNARQCSRPRNVGRLNCFIYRRPSDAFVLPANDAHDIEAPVGTGFVVRNTLEWYDKLGRPAVWKYAGLGVPERVPLIKKVGIVLNQTLAPRAE